MFRGFTLIILLSSFAISFNSLDEVLNFKINPKHLELESTEISIKFNEKLDKLKAKMSEAKAFDMLSDEYKRKIRDFTEGCLKEGDFKATLEGYIKLVSINYRFQDEAFSYNRVNFDNFIKIIKSPNLKEFIKKQNGEPLIRELLTYFDKIKSTKNWEDKLKYIINNSKQLSDLNRVIKNSGFNIKDNSCYQSSIYYDDNKNNIYFNNYQVNLESYFYSFWARRYMQGTMETTKRILEELIKN
jgi:hypothetical protein